MPIEKTGRVARCVTSLAFLLLFLTFQPVASAEIPFIESRTIEWGEYWNVEFDAEEGDTIDVYFEAYPPVDILVFDDEGYSQYVLAFFGNGTADSYGPGTRLNVIDGRYSFIIPQDGTYQFVIDNSHLPDNGASSGVRVNFSVRADITNAPEELDWSPGITLFPWIIIVILMALLVIGLVLATQFTKKKEREVVLLPYQVQVDERGQELVTCSKCGNPVPRGAYCAKCGERLQ